MSAWVARRQPQTETGQWLAEEYRNYTVMPYTPDEFAEIIGRIESEAYRQGEEDCPDDDPTLLSS